MGLGNAEIFARNLRRYVEESGKLGKDIAAAIGVAPATFSEWVNGKKYPRIDKIEMLANYFHIQKSDLIEDKSAGEKQKEDPARKGVVKIRSLANQYPDMSPEMQTYVDGYMDSLFLMLRDKFPKKGSDDNEQP